jgi:hypothetical protein
MTISRPQGVLTISAAVAILAGCGGGSFSQPGSPGVPDATVLPRTSGVQSDAASRTSTITVKWENTRQPVPDAVVKLGWGKNCGLLGCSSYQRSGKSGGKGRIFFMNLPSGNINWCVYASKMNATSIDCDASHNRPIDSAITIELAKTS